MKRSTFLGLCAVGGLILASGAPASAQITIDDFTVSQSVSVGPTPPGPLSASNGPIANSYGWDRTLTVNRTAGTGIVSMISNLPASRLSFSNDADSNGNGVVDLVKTGGAINLLAGGADGFDLRGSADLVATYTLRVFSAGGSSTGSGTFTAASFPTDISVLYSSFVLTSGTGADFSAVTRILVGVDGPSELDTTLDYIKTRVPPRITEVTPEPGALALVIPGLAPLAMAFRRRKKK